MSNLKNTKFYHSLKENRAIYITAVTLLVALAVVIGITTVANRSKKPPVSDNQGNTPAVTTPKEPDVTTPSDEPSSDVGKMLPTFSLPLTGNLAKGHDASVQVFSATMNDYRVHLGVDIASTLNAPVNAAADGTVERIWDDPLMGQCIAIKHGGDACSIYKNLSTEIPEGIQTGAKVEAGQLIGYIGETAMIEIADEPHLHYEMTVGGIQVNPLDYFEEEAIATLSKAADFEDETAQ